MTKKLSIAGLMIAIAVFSAHMISIPVGIGRAFPVQHMVNVLAGIWLGPSYAVAVAFCISLLRNLLGTGSILAFPGSMIGAYLVGYLYQKTNSNNLAYAGELIGTGIIGALIAALMTNFVLGKPTVAYFFIIPFIVSSACGTFLAAVVVGKGFLSEQLLNKFKA